MRVTFLLPYLNLSGGTRIVAQHADMLHRMGHAVVVVAGRRMHPVWYWRIIERAKGVRRPVQASYFDDAPFEVRVLERGRPMRSRDVPDADVILGTWWLTSEWMLRMPARKGVKVHLLQHYEAHPDQPKDRVDAVWKSSVAKIVVSSWLHDIARDQFEDPNAHLVPNGVDTDHFRWIQRGPSGRGVIGGMSSPSGFKRFALAAETVRLMQGRGADCEFMGFGSNVSGKSWMPDGSRFEVSPTQERIAEIYASCDCWLFTSDKEGYGLPILEAMSCGTPVVATRAGAAPELLASGGGILVDSDDPKDLADAVEHILNLDDESWREMSRAARAEAEKHSWDRIGGKMEEALKQILRESGRQVD